MAQWSGASYDFDFTWSHGSALKAYDLALPLEAGMPRHPHHPAYNFVLAKQHAEWPYPDGITAGSEMITTGGHVGTHIDALAHIALHGRIHGDRPLEESVHGGFATGSTEEIPPLLARGHLVDAPKIFGRELEPTDGIGPEQFEAWFADKEAPQPGSVVLVRTGWLRHWPNTDRYIAIETGLPGVNRAGAEWLSARGIVASGSDTMNYEHKLKGVVSLQVHVHYLVECGIFIMEQMNLDVLAADGVTDFTFIALPLRIKGGSGSPIRPVALVDR